MRILGRRKLNITGLVFLSLVFLLGVIRLFSGEDDWLCQNGEWVKHGMPSAPKPNKPCGSQVKPSLTPTPNINQQTFKVTKVIDGDTIEIENGQKVRYIGIDTPEMDDKDSTKVCYARQAFEKNKELVEGKEVKLVKDVSETDKYGRLLRYVYVGEIFVNDYLVKNGYANAVTYPPDVKYQEQFRQAEEEAKNNNLGFWDKNKCSL
jgi:micrococcal nuclease